MCNTRAQKVATRGWQLLQESVVADSCRIRHKPLHYRRVATFTRICWADSCRIRHKPGYWNFSDEFCSHSPKKGGKLRFLGTLEAISFSIVPKNGKLRFFWNSRSNFFLYSPKKWEIAVFLELLKHFLSHSSKPRSCFVIPARINLCAVTISEMRHGIL